MKFAIVYFTYGKDEKLLKESIKSVRLMQENYPQHQYDIFVYDDSTNPLRNIPKNVKYTKTTFNRGENLNGLECVENMVDIFNNIASQGYDWIVKTDSDVILLNTDFLRACGTSCGAAGATYKILNVEFGNQDYLFGMCECFNCKTIHLLKKQLENSEIRETIDMLKKEDLCMSILVKTSGLTIGALPEFTIKNVTELNNNNFVDLHKCYAIHCRAARIHGEDEWKNSNDLTLKIMRSYFRNRNKKYSISLNYMTYKGDQESLILSVRASLKVFEAYDLDIYVMDDDNNPMDQSYVDILCNLSSKVHYERTTFERNKNLNGSDCIIGMLNKFIEHAKNKPNGITIKMDPDTLVLRPYIVDAVMAHESGVCSSPRANALFSGVFYLIKNNLLKKALRIAKYSKFNKFKAPEDMCIGLCASIANIPETPLQIETGKGYDYSKELTDEQKNEYINTADFITFGDWFTYSDLSIKNRLQPQQEMLKEIEDGKTSNFITLNYF